MERSLLTGMRRPELQLRVAPLSCLQPDAELADGQSGDAIASGAHARLGGVMLVAGMLFVALLQLHRLLRRSGDRVAPMVPTARWNRDGIGADRRVRVPTREERFRWPRVGPSTPFPERACQRKHFLSRGRLRVLLMLEAAMHIRTQVLGAV